MKSNQNQNRLCNWSSQTNLTTTIAKVIQVISRKTSVERKEENWNISKKSKANYQINKPIDAVGNCASNRSFASTVFFRH